MASAKFEVQKKLNFTSKGSSINTVIFLEILFPAEIWHLTMLPSAVFLEILFPAEIWHLTMLPSVQTRCNKSLQTLKKNIMKEVTDKKTFTYQMYLEKLQELMMICKEWEKYQQQDK